MAQSIKTPSALNIHENLSENWRKFKQNFEIFVVASGQQAADDSLKIALLLNIIGEDAVELFNTFNLSDAQKKKYIDVVDAFEKYCSPKKNVVYERYKFYKRTQEDGEKFEDFLTDVRKMVKTCEFGNLVDDMIRDKLVIGVADRNLQERLLRSTLDDLTLEKTIMQCRTAEISRQQMEKLHEIEVNKISVQKTNKHFKEKKKEFLCNRCNRNHGIRECPAFGKTCSNCQKVNHFQICCRYRSRNVQEVGEAKQSDRDGDDDDFIDKTLNIGSIENKNAANKSWIHDITVEGVNIKVKLDCGAEVSTIPEYLYKKYFEKRPLIKSLISLTVFGGSVIKPIGTIKLHCKVKNKTHYENFFVVNHTHIPLLGAVACEALGLIKRLYSVKERPITIENFIKINADLFEGTGSFPELCKINIKKNIEPVVSPPRRIPIALKDKVKETLIALEKREIISKVENPCGWVSNLVVVEKKDHSLRFCIDPKHLNNVIIRPSNVLIPTCKELTEQLCGKRYFTVLDLKEGFWQIRLDPESANLCTFSTPFGCYKFNRMPFGIAMAPEYFQYINNKNFGDIPGVIVYFDDILIAANTMEEHDRILESVTDRARERNIKLNKSKIQFRKSSVKYLGHKFSAEGMSIDPERIKALQAVESPKNTKELQSVLGMFNFLREFIPNYSDLNAPLRELLKKDVHFEWLPKHQKNFEEIKEKITKAPVLENFNSSAKITLQCDASQNGLGCTLLQNKKPVCFASRSLNENEKNFAQIEKELLSIVFAFQKFHNFVYGQEIEVITDHKPLIGIINKKIADIASNRLKRLRIKLMRYRFKIEYLPGRYMFIADLLSRNYLKESEENEWVDEQIHSISSSINFSHEKKIQFQIETQNDPILKKIMEYNNNGWPKNIKSVPEQVRYYFKLQNEMHVEDKLIFLNYRLIVPPTLRSYILSLLHESHLGMSKTKERARHIIYWPGLNTDIENLIAKCGTCLKYSSNKKKEPMVKHDIPDLPFNKVGCDLLEFQNKSYLVLQDYLTKWLELVELKNKTAYETIAKLKNIFATHGIPSILIADNMPFNSREFKKFANDYNFEIITSSPHYPRSNGQAERAVQTAKNMIKKCLENKTDIEIALLEYRNTPILGVNLSPSQMLFGRRTKTKIPIHTELLKQKTEEDLQSKIMDRQEKYKVQYDKNATVEHRPFDEGDSVMVKNYYNKNWSPGKIITNHDAPRSYTLMNQQGNILRRNSSQIKKYMGDFVLNRDLPDEEIKANEPFPNENKPADAVPENSNFKNDVVDNAVSGNSNVKNNIVESGNVMNPTGYKTRSGRVVNPPYRYRN